MLHRRPLFIGGSAALALGASAAPVAAPRLGSETLSAIIQNNGQTYSYAEAEGDDLGDYVDPLGRFVQGCIRVTHDRLPMTVFFRPDRSSDRVEVVFELGRLWSAEPPVSLHAYRVSILRGDRIVFATDVPGHAWFTRWRWQSSWRRTDTRVSDLIATGLLPHYDNSANLGTARATIARTYQIMGLAGVFPGMFAGGERDDIGPITEQQADFVCTGRQSALDSLLAQAEGAGTLPWHYRDERTGAPLDTIRYGKASLYSPQTGDPFIATTNSNIHLDSAHEPALAYLPFLLTGDPYHLETLQFQTIFDVIEQPPVYRNQTGQVRAQAWSLRTLGQAAKVTPETTPRWLLPQSHFREQLAAEQARIMRDFVASDDVVRTVFRTTEQTFAAEPGGGFAAGTHIWPWQEEFLAFVLLWLVQMGHAAWEPVARWKLGSTIARTNGASGWMRAHPTPYMLALREQVNSPWLRSWSDAWSFNAAHQDLAVESPDHLAIRRASDITYPTYTRGVLAMAVRLGFAEARPCFKWIDAEISRNLARHLGVMNYKWSVTCK